MASKVSSPMRFLVALRDLIEREKIDGTDNWEKIAQLMKSLGEKSTAADRDRQILEIYKISSVLLESCLTKYSNEDLQSRTTLQDAVLVIDTCILPNTKNLISCSDYQISEEIKYTLCMIHQFIATESMVSDYISDSFESHVSNIESGWLNLFKCNIVINLNNICIKMRDIVTKLSPCSQNQLPFFTMTLSSTAKKNGNYLLKKIDREGNVIRIEAFHPIFLGFTPAKKSMKEWQARSKMAHQELVCAVCLDGQERALRDMVVASGCTHLHCISCANQWWMQKPGKFECPLCRTKSTECIRGSAYNTLVKNVFSNNLTQGS